MNNYLYGIINGDRLFFVNEKMFKPATEIYSNKVVIKSEKYYINNSYLILLKDEREYTGKRIVDFMKIKGLIKDKKAHILYNENCIIKEIIQYEAVGLRKKFRFLQFMDQEEFEDKFHISFNRKLQPKE